LDRVSAAAREKVRPLYDSGMIARIWRGATAADRAQDYLEYLKGTGLSDYTSTPGNHGVQVLMRTQGDRTDFTLISYWESLDAVKAFAGDDYETAVLYPEDDRFLIERDLKAAHYEVV
jgi:heme-degrading monooxygenase HmoA